MSNKRVTIIECVVVDILENNLRCLVNYKCIHERTLNNLRTIFKNIYLFSNCIWFFCNSTQYNFSKCYVGIHQYYRSQSLYCVLHKY